MVQFIYSLGGWRLGKNRNTYTHTGIFVWCGCNSSLAALSQWAGMRVRAAPPDRDGLEDNRLALKHTSDSQRSESRTRNVFTAKTNITWAPPADTQQVRLIVQTRSLISFLIRRSLLMLHLVFLREFSANVILFSSKTDDALSLSLSLSLSFEGERE